MKIYTRGGDQGTTSLYGGGRVPKYHARMHVVGTLDELNALRACRLPASCDGVVEQLQQQLFDLGAELASPGAADQGLETVGETDVTHQESVIDDLDSQLSPLETFILPGGTQAASTLHLARSVCRRGEREIVSLAQEAPVRDTVLKFINRTSDLLFVLARQVNQESKTVDIAWKKRSERT